MKVNIFYTTLSSSNTYKELANKLLEEKQIICVNIIKNIESFYKEDGLLKTANESIMIIKTFLSKSNLEKLLMKHHPYDTPFIAKILIDDVNAAYTYWAKKNL
jgi:periplasmic divalent cation tolerance protein